MKSHFEYYQLVGNNHPLSLRLETKNTKRKSLLFDFEEKDGTIRTRPLRYASNKDSIFEDEQHGEVITPSVYFDDGSLTVDKRKGEGKILIKFLEHHPDNVKNGGSVFKRRDFEAEAKDAERMMDIEDKARDLAREISADEARAAHRIFFPTQIVEDLSGAEIRRNIRNYAKQSPEDFLDVIGEPETEHNDTLETALENGLVQFRNNNSALYYNLKNSKKMICRIPVGEDPNEAVKEFLLTNDGLEHLRAIEEAIAEL